MRYYPGEVSELRFFTNLERGFRKSRWLVYLGALLYWAMGRFKTRRPRLLTKETISQEEPKVSVAQSQGGLEYSDSYLRDNDARFVFNFIMRAARSGAVTLNYTKAVAASFSADKIWHISAKDQSDGSTFEIKAKVLVNAAGPYVDAFNRVCGVKTVHQHIFSKGVHLIVPRINASDKVLTFFADDGRLFFAIPMGGCSCIGTTDTRVTELPAIVTEADRRFILSNINKRVVLEKPLTTQDIIAERCGVRPLVIKGNAQDFAKVEWAHLSRKHIIECHREKSQISVFGGKLTDCLNIGRELVDHVRQLGVPAKLVSRWYGEDDGAYKQDLIDRLTKLSITDNVWPGEGTIADRLWRLYGHDALSIVESIRTTPELQGRLVEEQPVLLAEVAYMAEHEMVLHLDDLLRRRTRLGLVVQKETLKQSHVLRRAADILFGTKAESEWQAYFNAEN
jgi:glycerol-3-phosphate dehydrogenase